MLSPPRNMKPCLGHKYICTYVYVYIYIYIYTHIYVDVYIYIYIYCGLQVGGNPKAPFVPCFGCVLRLGHVQDAILYYTMLCYAILYYTMLCYTILYYNILYYIISYYTILYHTILQTCFVKGVTCRPSNHHRVESKRALHYAQSPYQHCGFQRV